MIGIVDLSMTEVKYKKVSTLCDINIYSVSEETESDSDFTLYYIYN